MSIHLPSLSLLVSVLVRWPCSISIHVSPRPVTGGVRPFSLAHAACLFICLRGLSLLVSALFRWRCNISIHVSQACHWWCPPFSAGISILASPRSVAGVSFSIGHEAFLFICLPGPLLLVSALFRWPCSISIHLSSRSVTAGVSPFPLAMLQFYSFVFQVCHCMSDLFRWPCSISIHLFPVSVTAAALFRWPCSISIHLSPM